MTDVDFALARDNMIGYRVQKRQSQFYIKTVTNNARVCFGWMKALKLVCNDKSLYSEL